MLGVGAGVSGYITAVILRPRVPPKTAADGCIGAAQSRRRRKDSMRTPSYAGRLAVNDGLPKERDSLGTPEVEVPLVNNGGTTSPSRNNARGIASRKPASELPKEA